MRHGCRESPAGYRDVPSGRASVAGEFARVARLCRARMRGKPFWFLLWRLTKGTRPRGRNKKSPQTRSGAVQPNKTSLGSRVRGNDGVRLGVGGWRLTDTSLRTAPSPFRAGRAAEGWGEGTLNPSTYATRKLRSRASSLLQKPPPSRHEKTRQLAGFFARAGSIT